MTQRLTDVFRLFDTAIVADAMDEHGLDGVLTGFETPAQSWTAVGRADTVRMEPAPDPGTEATNFPFAMLSELRADRVLVVSGTDPTVSCWGGNASRLAAAAGTSGVVVDGGYRDAPDVGEGAVPVFARARTPRSGQRRVTVAGAGNPVTVDGVEIAPDDVVVADGTGVVVVPADEARAVAATAEEILAEERLLEAKIANGATVADLQTDGHSF